jgi:pimeloyl-ACP methyl ester carboxylesterase
VSSAVTEVDLRTPDGRNLHVYDTGGTGLPVVWHHGTPNVGEPPEPLFPAAERLGVRWLSYDRPGYGGSSPRVGRDVASAAGDVAVLADALGVDRFAVVAHSGGVPHALACAALLPDRVTAAVGVAGPAPFDADGLDWFAGMAASQVASLGAAAAGRAAKERYETDDGGHDPELVPADEAILTGDWSWLLDVVGPAVVAGPQARIDDDLAFVAPWGFDPARVVAPVLLLHGGRDRVVPAAHSAWLARRCPEAELRVSPDDGHLSILDAADAALEWLVAVARR